MSRSLPPLPRPSGQIKLDDPRDGNYCRLVDAYTEEQMIAYVVADRAAQVENTDWAHLKQYGYAPGGYMSRCRKCGATPVMDKRATTCRECAEAMHAEKTAAKEPTP